MTQYQLVASASPSTPLVVTAIAVITNIVINKPTSPQVSGATLYCEFTYTNGTVGVDWVVFTLKDQTGATLGTKGINPPANANGSLSITFTMPNRDTTLTLTSDHGGSGTKLIQLLTLVATTLTLVLTPNPAPAGESVAVSGKLSRADGLLTGIGSQQIVFKLTDGVAIGTFTTDANGNYTGSFLAPAAGTYNYQTTYAGSGILSASFSNVVRFGIEAAIRSLLNILAPLITGAALITVTKR